MISLVGYTPEKHNYFNIPNNLNTDFEDKYHDIENIFSDLKSNLDYINMKTLFIN